MWLHDKKIEETFRKVHAIREHMQMCCLAPDRAKLSVEDLQWVIADLYELTIEKREVSFDGVYLHGLVERYQSRARILVRKSQDDDDVRFASVKELCQIAISEREDWSVEGTETLDALLYEVHLDHHKEEKEGKPATAPDHPIQSEKLAEIAAIELMYPFSYREADKRAVEESKTTVRALAAHFHVPEFVVGRALHPKYHAMAIEYWGRINK